MNFLELVKSRYSCRAYKSLSVEREKLDYILDIAIAVEHLCLAATEQGLATCWVCNFDAALCKQLFGLPANEEPAVVIPLGYADDDPKEKKRKPIEDIIR